MERLQTVEILKALADDTRLSIVRKIATSSDAIPSCDLSDACNQKLSQPAMSHHINRLVTVGILREEKSGTKKRYTLCRDKLNQIGIDVTKL
jgi:DNA-binding transcriptional ArsR family regulator